MVPTWLAESTRAGYAAGVFRLLLSIVALLLALPATAAPACHDGVPSRAPHAMHHQGTGGMPVAPAVAVHDCIGCIPPSNWIGSPLPSPMIASAQLVRPGTGQPPHGRAAKPVPPPPRWA